VEPVLAIFHIDLRYVGGCISKRSNITRQLTVLAPEFRIKSYTRNAEKLNVVAGAYQGKSLIL
jgi:hypothetical protein